MEKKITQRLIGVLVMVALVIIFLPIFLSGGSDATHSTTTAAANPAPEQQQPLAQQTTNPIPDAQAAQAQMAQLQTQDPAMQQQQPQALDQAAPTVAVNPMPLDSQAAPTPTAQAPEAAAANTPPPLQTADLPPPTPPAQSTADAGDVVTFNEHIAQITHEKNLTADTSNPVPTTTNPPVAQAAPQQVAEATPATPQPQAPQQVTPEAVQPKTVALNDAPGIPVETKPAPAPQKNTKESSAVSDVVTLPLPEKQEKQPATPEKHATAAPSTHKAQPHHGHNAHNSHDNHNNHTNVSKIQDASWVVQLGSFRVKPNAVRLTNRLRAQGFNAFMKEIGKSTRVYVGPEDKPQALALSRKLEEKTTIHGILVNFKPLEL